MRQTEASNLYVNDSSLRPTLPPQPCRASSAPDKTGRNGFRNGQLLSCQTPHRLCGSVIRTQQVAAGVRQGNCQPHGTAILAQYFSPAILIQQFGAALVEDPDR